MFKDGKTIPEMRGMPPVPRDRAKPYSAVSYAAQYGIFVEDAEAVVEQCDSHQQCARMINAMFAADLDLRRRALMLEPDTSTGKLREDELRMLERIGVRKADG